MLFPLDCCQLVQEQGLVGLRCPLAVEELILAAFSVQSQGLCSSLPLLFFQRVHFPHAVLSCKWVSSCWGVFAGAQDGEKVQKEAEHLWRNVLK